MSLDETLPTSSDPWAGQRRYQVRFDWGGAGAARIADGADVTVWVDQVRTDAAGSPSAFTPFVVEGSLQNAVAVAQWVLARQEERGDRFTVAVVAAGHAVSAVVPARDPDAGGETDAAEPRFAVEDLFAAGAVVDALTAVGLDHCSPEAAAAAAAYAGLRGAMKHLVKNAASVVEHGVTTVDFTPSDDVVVLHSPR
ncbi:hypothetical protein [Ruicaihuangia caeni]|uniref:hypothetical protein n=1 Tax=Ruicaihuangia caeni TaxID=3042517 RepID=UPI00338F3C9F